jgi:RNA polymerase sigma factor (sigma-70 family)
LGTISLPARGRPIGSKRVLAVAGDERLVAQIRRGSERAFEVAFERYGPGILAFSRHMLGSTEEAEDVVQHTFAAAYRELVRDERPITLKPWLYTIARNRCLSLLRARRESLVESPEIPTAGLHEEVQRRADLREMLEDLRELPDEQRTALLLAEVGDMPHSEIAQVLDCGVDRVKALVFRARSGLIERREARETPCEEIREQLANLRGGALRRSELRYHLRTCAGCREFREEVKRQRSMLALALPVTPSLGLKASVLGALGLGGGSAGGGAAAGGLAAAAAGPAASATIAKVAVVGVLAGGGIVAGDAVLQNSDPVDTHSAPAATQRPADAAHASDAVSARSEGIRQPPFAAPQHRGRRKAKHGSRGAHGHPLTGKQHAGPKAVPPQSHANPPGRPAPTKPPVRRHGAGVRHKPKVKNAPPRADPGAPGLQAIPPGEQKKSP